MNILDLYSKPVEHKFNPQEIDFIKSKLDKNSMRVKYVIYRKTSPKGVYLGIMIDFTPNSIRQSPVLNSWEVICDREVSDGEYMDMVNNFGRYNRRFLIYMYKTIENLINDDLLYDVQTPTKFITESINRGYSSKK